MSIISIHSPRMGRDRMFNFNKWGHRISIHSPRMGRDRQVLFLVRLAAQFQSTLPAWGETYFFTKSAKRIAFQSTLPAWGETYNGSERYSDLLFQSTLPAWGETVIMMATTVDVTISIHSPRMGRDMVKDKKVHLNIFQSTLPAWGETCTKCRKRVLSAISIHSPRMGRDRRNYIT